MGALIIDLPGRLLVVNLPAAQPTIRIMPKDESDLERIADSLQPATGRWLRAQNIPDHEFQRRIAEAYRAGVAADKAVKRGR
jgi:hypothetical protein